MSQAASAAEKQQIAELVGQWSKLWIPRERLELAAWTEKNFILSPEYAARPGPLTLYGWQHEILNSFTDPRVMEIWLMCGTQIIKTLFIQAAIAYTIAEDPGPMLALSPTESDAKSFSKERIGPMIRDIPALNARVSQSKSRDSNNTILEKRFPGGILALAGAGTPGNVARRSTKVFIADEVDKYKASAGKEGDVLRLGDERTATFGTLAKKIRCCSPTVAGKSRIATGYATSDQRKPWVPCWSCGQFQILKWEHVRWQNEDAATAAYGCAHCTAQWNDVQRWAACELAEWRAENPFKGIAGFWISHLYSPWKTLAQIVDTYLVGKDNPQEHKTFVNTNLAELWEEQGETPDYEVLMGRREKYSCNDDAIVPMRGLFLTCFVDVQESPPRLEYEVVAWGRDRENWSLAYGSLQVIAQNGEPLPVTSPELWEMLDTEVLQRDFEHASGARLPIMVMAIDTGMRPRPVYEFARKHARPSYSANGLVIRAPRTVVPTKGNDDDLRVISRISKEDAARKRRNLRIVSIGTHCVKQELYDLLRDVEPRADGSASPRCHHFPLDYEKSYFEGLCSEIRVVSGLNVEWKRRPNVRNEPLDLKVGNRAAAAMFGIDRFGEKQWAALERGLIAIGTPSVANQPEAAEAEAAPIPAKPAAAATVKPARRKPRTVPSPYL